jgi:hypothetical protein
MRPVSEQRRFLAIVLLFLIGFGMIALANALDAYWPLFLTVIPYSVIPWTIVRHERAQTPALAPDDEAPTA